MSEGSWNSINLLEVSFDEDKVTFTLMTTIFIEVKNNIKDGGNFMIMGNSTRKSEKTFDIPEKEEECFYLCKICSMIEEQESSIRL